jgi:hypothetical protein
VPKLCYTNSTNAPSILVPANPDGTVIQFVVVNLRATSIAALSGMLRALGETWRYRGREIGSDQIAFLQEFIGTHAARSRWKLSRQLREALEEASQRRSLRRPAPGNISDISLSPSLFRRIPNRRVKSSPGSPTPDPAEVPVRRTSRSAADVHAGLPEAARKPPESRPSKL